MLPSSILRSASLRSIRPPPLPRAQITHQAHHIPHFLTRKMSTEPVRRLFLVYAPDYTDEDALSRRLAVRAKHLEEAHPLIEQGWSSASPITLSCRSQLVRVDWVCLLFLTSPSRSCWSTGHPRVCRAGRREEIPGVGVHCPSQ